MMISDKYTLEGSPTIIMLLTSFSSHYFTLFYVLNFSSTWEK